jgi:hypothetical protein
MRPAVLLAALAASLTFVAAAQAAPTRAEFIRKGDAVCVQTQKELVPLRARAQAAKLLPQREQWAAAATIWADQIRIQRRFVARMTAIGTPTGDLAARRITRSLTRSVSFAVAVQRAFAERNARDLSPALSAYLEFTVALNRRVVSYGFRRCGR